MRALVQRVSRARVAVEGETVGEIGRGLLILAAVREGDDDALAKRLAIPTAETVFPAGRVDVEAFLEGATFPVMLKAIDGTRLQAQRGRVG